MNPTKNPRITQIEPQNESIELSYYKKKCISLELKIVRLKLEKSELANEIIRMKLGEK